MTQLPPSLERYQAQLEAAVARDVEHRSPARRARPILMRVAAVGAGAAVILAGLSVAGVFGGGDGSGGPSIVEQAAAAIVPAEDGILHVHILGTQTNPDGTVAKWEDESWQSMKAPYARRQIEKTPGTAVTESAMDGEQTSRLYDAATKTIYQFDESAVVSPGSSPVPRPKASADPDGADARAKAAAADQVGDTPGSAREGGAPLSFDELIGQEALGAKLQASTADLLQSGNAKIDGHETVGGRDAIRIVISSTNTYLIDARTYAPLEWRTQGGGSGVVLRFTAYEQLPDTAANRALLDLEKQHPDATVDTDPAHYQDASGRLFPNG